MSILCYHSVSPDWQSDLAVSPHSFEEQCSWLRRHRRVLDLEEALARMSHFHLPRGCTAVTFDDGFSDLHQHALPVLARHRIPATVFLVARQLSMPNQLVDWVDSPPAFPLRTLTAEEILEMQDAGMRFGSHGLTHRSLTLLSDKECQSELKDSRDILEAILERPVPWLAYPRGLHNDRVRRAAARAGYSHAFAMHERGQPVDRFAIPRVGIFRNNGLLTLRIKSSREYPRIRRSAAVAAMSELFRRRARS